jgi:hypothetical protein
MHLIYLLQQDVEAQNTVPGQSVYPTSRPSEYAHSGRGGAGNWYTPEEVDLNKQSDPPASTATRTPQLSGKFGRGGAGNYSTEFAEKQREQQERILREKEEKVNAQTAKDVELGLKMPERAHLNLAGDRL